MKTLHLTLKAKFFHMILVGIKPEEYREIKPYWIKRLAKGWNFLDAELTIWEIGNEMFEPLHFDTVTFSNGYSKTSRKMIVECKGISIGKAVPEWSDNWQGDVFVIKLGKVLKTENI